MRPERRATRSWPRVAALRGSNRMRKVGPLLAFVLMVLVADAAWALELAGRVVGIADGDTLTLLDGDYHQTRVRLARSTRQSAANPMVNAPNRRSLIWRSAAPCAWWLSIMIVTAA